MTSQEAPVASFDSLPVELRSPIYTAYFYSSSPIYIPFIDGPPALLTVSKTIRSEALYSFYHDSRFVLDFLPSPLSIRRLSDVYNGTIAHVMDPESERYLTNLSARNLGSIRRLQLRVGHYENGRLAVNIEIGCDGKQDGKAFGVEVRDLIKGEERYHISSGCLWELVALGQIERLVREIAEREGRRKFSIDDIEAFEDALTF